jgi:hypothetical protein
VVILRLSWFFGQFETKIIPIRSLVQRILIAGDQFAVWFLGKGLIFF